MIWCFFLWVYNSQFSVLRQSLYFMYANTLQNTVIKWQISVNIQNCKHLKCMMRRNPNCIQRKIIEVSNRRQVEDFPSIICWNHFSCETLNICGGHTSVFFLFHIIHFVFFQKYHWFKLKKTKSVVVMETIFLYHCWGLRLECFR